jgi:diaminohydroxyphosphoribosylaminopyrimidine deaminase / 5-amino-6-(5-phosphoribosylamino)uracil reductase
MTSSDDDRRWMELAIDLAHQCPSSEGAYSVGAVIVDSDGNELARGYSREDDPHVHAEESALGKLAADEPRLAGATIYSTLEPCSQRKSRALTCTQLILATGIRRVVIAWLEPALFVADCQGRAGNWLRRPGWLSPRSRNWLTGRGNRTPILLFRFWLAYTKRSAPAPSQAGRCGTVRSPSAHRA